MFESVHFIEFKDSLEDHNVIYAGCVVLARRTSAIIDVNFAIPSFKSEHAVASVIGYQIDTETIVKAGIADALIDVVLAQWTYI